MAGGASTVLEVVLAVGFLVFPLAAVGLIVWLLHQKQRRADRQQAVRHAWAAHHGLRPLHPASSLAHRWPGEPFRATHSSQVRAAVVGPYRGRDTVVLDHLYQAGSNTPTVEHTVVVVALPVPLTTLGLRFQRGPTAFGRFLAGQDIEVDNVDFNDAYVITSASERFAYDVLHPRAQELVLAGARWQRLLRIDGAALVSWAPRTEDPRALDDWLLWLEAFIGHIPRFTWQEHGYDPATGAVRPPVLAHLAPPAAAGAAPYPFAPPAPTGPQGPVPSVGPPWPTHPATGRGPSPADHWRSPWKP